MQPRLWTGAFGLAGIAAAFMGQSKPSSTWTIVVGGGVSGYLSPCGCTYPMSGGIRRWATEVRARIARGPTLVLENGGLVAGSGAQDRLKAEALAEALGQVRVAAINLTATEARLGRGEVSQLSQLANAPFVATQLPADAEIGLRPFTARKPFLIGAAVDRASSLATMGQASGSPVQAAERLVQEAKSSGLAPILMFSGDEDAAAELARQVPDLRLIVFSRGGDPPYQDRVVGKTVLLTPGDQGKFLVQISYSENRFAGYNIVDLGPSVKDDPLVSKVYSAYLRTVDRENLLGAYPRVSTAEYAGAARCGSCHQQAMLKWKSSKHSGSFADLKAQGHGGDPDCVVCHVTGLGSDHGFRSSASTPDLAYVGCESCHGPGAAHAANPYGVKLPKAGKASCVSCHDLENSPHFDFLTYWARIQHN